MRAPALRTPRIVMHRCSASITTITPRGLEDLHQRVGDLGGQPLLHLRALGVDVDQPGQLGQPGDLAALGRDVADVGDAGERHQVVLAHRPELDVADQDHLVVADVEGRGEHVLGRHAAARRSARRTRGRPGPGCRAAPRARGPRRSRSAARGRRPRPASWSNAGTSPGARSTVTGSIGSRRCLSGGRAAEPGGGRPRGRRGRRRRRRAAVTIAPLSSSAADAVIVGRAGRGSPAGISTGGMRRGRRGRASRSRPAARARRRSGSKTSRDLLLVEGLLVEQLEHQRVEDVAVLARGCRRPPGGRSASSFLVSSSTIAATSSE